MKKLSIVVLLVMFSLKLSAGVKVGYLPSYRSMFTSPSTTPFNKLTHINLAFINPSDASGSLLFENESYMNAFVTAAHTNNVKVYVSLAGAMGTSSSTYGYLKTLISSTTLRATLENNLITFINKYSLDGLDIDIETDLLQTLSQNGSYPLFISELKSKLTNKGLTVALPTGYYASFVTTATLNTFDWINVMSYDKYGTWTGPGQHSSFADFLSDANYYITTRGLDLNRVVMGVPFYGYGWQGSTSTGSVAISYGQLITKSSSNSQQDSYSDPSGYLYYYNGIPTIQDKADEIDGQGYGGIMIWEISQDAPAPYSLLDVINSSITTGVADNIIDDSSVKVYPNPSKSKIYISDSKAKNAVIQNINGVTVLETTFQEGSSEINIESLTSGLYILKLYEEKGVIVKKIIKE